MSATSMRIEVESKQSSAGVKTVSYPDSVSGPGYTTTTRVPPVDSVRQGYLDAMSKAKNEKETAERIAAKEKDQRRADDRQERDEAWAARQEAREQKRQEAEAARRQRKQDQDENYAEKQSAKAARQQEAEAARQDKRKEADAAKAARQQEKDENYYAGQLKRDQAARNAVDPQYIASRMMEQQQLRQAAQSQYIQAQLGISPGGAMSRVAGAFSSVNNKVAAFGNSLGAATRLIGGVAIVMGAAYSAYRRAIDTLIEESRKVARFSPELRMQEVRNVMREVRTDRRIASEYGAQMAEVSNRESRKEAAHRIIGVELASATEKIFGPIDELYTKIVEFIAGTGRINDQSVDYLKRITKLNEQQLQEMGVSKRDQQDIGDAVKTAENLLKALGSSGLDEKDPVNPDNFWGDKKALTILERNADNPGLIPNMLPRGWNNG